MNRSQTFVVVRVFLTVLIILYVYVVFFNTQSDHEDTLNKEIETEFQQRREQVSRTCWKYGRRLKVPLKLYNKKLRFDVKHKLMYCENYKIGSSTWATHLLKMNHIPIFRRTPIHIVARKHFPPLHGRVKEQFLEAAETIIIARDPFERLLSSYQDKLNMTHRPTMVTWDSFGQVQRMIKAKYREEPRPGNIPTFEEFVRYLVGELSPSTLTMKKMTRMINEHWKPVYLNCAPCSQSYSTIIKMETFTRDSWYIKNKLNLDINVDFSRRSGREGHTTVDKTVEAFKSIGKGLIRKLAKIYKYDFELFGYNPEKYLNISG